MAEAVIEAMAMAVEAVVMAVTAAVGEGAEGTVETSAVWMGAEAKTVNTAEVKVAAKAMAVVETEGMMMEEGGKAALAEVVQEWIVEERKSVTAAAP